MICVVCIGCIGFYSFLDDDVFNFKFLFEEKDWEKGGFLVVRYMKKENGV